MNRVKIGLVLFVLSLATTSLYALPQPAVTMSYYGYNPQTRTNDLPQSIIYQFPDPKDFGYGPFPLFVWVPSTLASNKDIMSMTFVTQMTQRGFVAASVQYANNYLLQTCSEYQKRSQAIFEASRPSSALGVLCSLNGVSCGKGVTVAGLSQGGALAIMAKNYGPAVLAVFAMGISDYDASGAGVDLSSCLDDSQTVIPANRLMVVNGKNDEFFGGQTALQNISGFTCPSGSRQCWSPDGSGAGWYVVDSTQVTDGNADHCYYMNGDCSLTTFDRNWYLPSTYNWSMKPNLDWLATFGVRRVFSAAGQ